MTKKLSDEDREHIQLQVTQITAFLDHCYDCMCHDVEISWTLKDGWDPVKKMQRESYGGKKGERDYIKRKGKHTKITVGFGDAYYGSTSLGRMLHEVAYQWREKLLVQLEDAKQADAPSTFVDVVKS